jgi:hypothetical protein
MKGMSLDAQFFSVEMGSYELLFALDGLES